MIEPCSPNLLELRIGQMAQIPAAHFRAERGIERSNVDIRVAVLARL
jgi:hypothetical protein